MKSLVLVLLLVIHGTCDFNCDTSECGNYDLGILKIFILNSEEQNTFCPKILRYFDCLTEAYATCFKKSIEELASSSNECVATDAREHLNLNSLALDICSKESSLYKDLMESAECIEKLTKVDRLCTKVAMDVLKLKGLIPKDRCTKTLDPPIFRRFARLFDGCVSLEFKEECGAAAQRAHQKIVKRLTHQLEDCSPEVKVFSKRNFLEILHFNETDKANKKVTERDIDAVRSLYEFLGKKDVKEPFLVAKCLYV